MRSLLAAFVAALVGLAAQHSCIAFTLNDLRQRSYSAGLVPSRLFISQESKNPEGAGPGTPCEIPDGVEVADLVNENGGGERLRNALVTDINGNAVPLDLPMGKGTSIVVFLRHLG